MRKLSLLLLALMVVSGAAFAQLVVEPTVEAEGYATFGVDLDKGVSGIQSGVSSEISFTFVEEQTQEFGEGDVYGYIEVEDFEVTFSSDNVGTNNEGDDAGMLDVTAGDVTAKVIFGPAFLELNSSIDEVDSATDFSLIAADIIAPSGAVVNAQTTEYAGVTLGASLEGLMDVSLSLASEYDWVQDDATAPITNDRNIENAYMMGLEVDVTAIDMVGITLTSNMQFGTPTGKTNADGETIKATLGSLNNPAAIGLGLSYDMPMGDMTLTPEFGVDVVFEKANSPNGDAAEDAPMGMDLEIGLGGNLTWAGLGIDEDDADYFGLEDQETTSGVGFGVTYSMVGAADTTLNTDGEFTYYSQPWINVKLGLFEDEGDDGLLPVVGAALIMNYNMYLGNEYTVDTAAGLDVVKASYSQLGFGLEVNADLGVVSPYFGLITGTNQLADKTDESGATETETKAQDFGLTVNLGTDINVISDTTFTIDWASGNLNRDSDTSTAYDTNDYTIAAGLGNATSKLGVVTIKTTVEF